MNKKPLDTQGAEYVQKRMPMIGIGTWEVRGEKTIFDVLDAGLEVGYRFVDTAQVYRNETEIGTALQKLLPKYHLSREDIFITSKLAPSHQGAKLCRQTVLESLNNLQTDYLDLLLIHWPGASKIAHDDPRNSTLRAESWKELEKLYNEGKLRAIGVSNYNISHLEELLKEAEVLLAVNQCEYHPHWYDLELVDYCREHGIHFQAYSSFGSASNRRELFEDKKICAMAAKYKCSVSEFLLAWAMSQGMSVLPRSTNPEHVRANYIADKEVQIAPEDVEAVRAKRMKKACWDPIEIR